MLTVRPKIAELVFQLYGRPLHPELFEIYCSRTVERGDYQAKIDITSAGHVVTWRYAGLTLTEVAASAQHPLPKRRRLMSYGLRGQRTDRVKCRGGVCYQMSFQLEPVEPEVFWTFQQELAQDGLAPRHVAPLRFQRPHGPGRAKLYQHRNPQPPHARPGLPHLPRRLRHRQKPVAVSIAVNLGKTACDFALYYKLHFPLSGCNLQLFILQWQSKS